MSEAEMVPVTQAARDAAAALTGDETIAYGMADLGEVVQAFARAMLAAEAAAIEKVACHFEALATMMDKRSSEATDDDKEGVYSDSARMHRVNASVVRSLRTPTKAPDHG